MREIAEGKTKNKTGLYALHVAVHVANLDVLKFKSSRQAIPHILQEEPASSHSRSHSVLTVGQDEKTVYCPEGDLSKIESFTFDYVYRQQSLTDTHLLQGSVVHLVRSILTGESASVFVMGESSVGKSIVCEGRATGKISGLIPQVAHTIFSMMQYHEKVHGDIPSAAAAEKAAFSPTKCPLRPVAHNATEHSSICKARVTVTWFQVDDHNIVDLLSLAASGQHNGTASVSGRPHPLAIRESPHGHGVHVPGLWEIEVESADDVRELIQSVRRHEAPPTAHSVFTITVTEASPKALTSDKSSNDASRSGKLMIVSLGDSIPKSGHSSGSSIWSNTSKWMHELRDTLDSIENKRPALRTRSRVAMLFKEAILGLIPSALICTLDPSLEAAASSLRSLQVVGGNSPEPVYSECNASRPPAISAPSAVQSSFRGGDHTIISTAPGGNENVDTLNSHFLQPEQTPPPVAPTTLDRLDLLHDQGSVDPVELPAEEEKTDDKFDHHSSKEPTDLSTILESSLEPATEPVSEPGAQAPAQAQARLYTRRQQLQLAGQRQEAREKGNWVGDPSSSTNLDWSTAGPAGGGMSMNMSHEDITHNFHESGKNMQTALLEALEASRAEVAELESRIHVLEEQAGKHDEQKAVLESKLGKMQQEAKQQEAKGSVRNRLRHALQEVRDYEVYKDVMEAAVTRIQGEMKKLVDERDQMKKSVHRSTGRMLKTKNVAQAGSLEVQRLKATVAKAHERIQVLQSENSTLKQEAQRQRRQASTACDATEEGLRKLLESDSNLSAAKRQFKQDLAVMEENFLVCKQQKTALEKQAAAHTKQLMQERENTASAQRQWDACREQLGQTQAHLRKALERDSPEEVIGLRHQLRELKKALTMSEATGHALRKELQAANTQLQKDSNIPLEGNQSISSTPATAETSEQTFTQDLLKGLKNRRAKFTST